MHSLVFFLSMSVCKSSAWISSQFELLNSTICLIVWRFYGKLCSNLWLYQRAVFWNTKAFPEMQSKQHKSLIKAVNSCNPGSVVFSNNGCNSALIQKKNLTEGVRFTSSQWASGFFLLLLFFCSVWRCANLNTPPNTHSMWLSLHCALPVWGYKSFSNTFDTKLSRFVWLNLLVE